MILKVLSIVLLMAIGVLAGLAVFRLWEPAQPERLQWAMLGALAFSLAALWSRSSV